MWTPVGQFGKQRVTLCYCFNTFCPLLKKYVSAHSSSLVWLCQRIAYRKLCHVATKVGVCTTLDCILIGLSWVPGSGCTCPKVGLNPGSLHLLNSGNQPPLCPVGRCSRKAKPLESWPPNAPPALPAPPAPPPAAPAAPRVGLLGYSGHLTAGGMAW